MSKLQIRVTILFLAATLAAFGVVSVAPDTAADVGTEVETGMARRVRDADFLRHNYSTNPRAAKVKSGMERRVHDADFLRHNYATPSSAAVVAAAGSPQIQDDPEPIVYSQNRR